MRVTLIAAVASNGVIGRDNQLPWRIPGDLPRFKQLTIGQTLVMGRKTYDSIGRPLPGRASVVISRNPGWAAPPGVELAAGFEQALARVKTAECFVAGGGEIYALALPRADRLMLTEIAAPFDGDARFPWLSPADWRLDDEAVHPAGDSFPYQFAYRTYSRVRR